MPQELYHFTHSSPEITTVADLLANADSPAFLYNKDPNGFLQIIGEDGLTNRQRIEATYTLPGDAIFKGAKFSRLILKVGTLLYIEYEKVNQPSFLTEGIEVVSNDEPAFKAAKLAELEADKGYYQIDKPIHGQSLSGISQENYPDVSVWIWCAALSPRSNEDNELSGSFFNLSPFIEKCTTNMTKNGGNFSIKLPPLVCELDDQNRWSIKKTTIDQYTTANDSSLQGEGYVAQSSLYHSETAQENPNKASDDTLVRNQMFFHNAIGSNDLVFIRFETLEMEKDVRYSDAQEYLINKNNLANRIYDMIGLVDSNSQSVNPANNDVSIDISGRDLSKLFIEDGTYFYALENSQGQLKFAGQSTIKSSLISRIFADNGMSFIGLYQFTSIEYILKFIIQQLSTIKVVPSDIFTSYATSKKIENGVEKEYDSRTKTYTDFDVTAKDKLTDKKYKQKLAAGIWQIIDLVIDKTVANRRLADSSFSTANGSLLNFIRSACQEPLVEFYMDTYGDKYHLIVRRPPYDQQGLISLIEGKVNTETGIPLTPPAIVDVEATDVLQENLSFDDSQVYSWYHFFPRNAMIGNNQDYSLSYLGALYFPEYADVWGSKPFQQSHSYVPYVATNNSNDAGLGLDERQAVEDMKYVIESNQYLPFTRKGTLTLNRDRRLKIGNILRYKSTGEIFFIEAVQHSFVVNENMIEAVTSVRVSRGMIEQLIYGQYLVNENGQPRFVSYFNIIDTRLVYNKVEVTLNSTKRVKKETVPVFPGNLYIGITVREKGGNIGIGNLDTYNAYPENKGRFADFINHINDAGYWVQITPLAANRTYAQQAALNFANPANADPGHSKHERGAAIDITLIDKKTMRVHSKQTSLAAWIATGVPDIASSLGFRWAGGNGSFGTYVDRVHFEIISKGDQLSIAQQEADEYEDVTEQTKKMVIDKTAIFQNFKVNQFAFNFFRKKLQFSPEYRNVVSRVVYDNGGALLNDVIVRSGKKKQ